MGATVAAGAAVMTASAADRAAAARILAAVPPPEPPHPGECSECSLPLTVSGDWPDQRRFEPWHVFCDLCGHAEHPQAPEMTTDWNGDIGCHRSCERKAARARG